MGLNLKIVLFSLASLWTVWFEQAHAGIFGNGRGLPRFGSNGRPSPSPLNGICADGIIPFGYKCQEIYVTTEDGYILNVQRITEGRKASVYGRIKQPVLLQHGIFVDGMSWLLNSPEQNLPMILADKGYDVWIANSRGTKFSRRHKSMDARSPSYWDWSWYELGKYDQPAVFNHIYKETGQKISYIGHSLGTLTALTSFSEGRLVDQVRSAVLLTPIAYLSHMTTVAGNVAVKYFAAELVKLFGIAEFDPIGKQAAIYLKDICAFSGVNCFDIMSDLSGPNCCINSSTFDRIVQHGPQSTSTRNLLHLSQTSRSGILAKYNYDRLDYNMFHYGRMRPPVFDLTKIPNDIPLFLGHGGRDALSDLGDVEFLLGKLKNHDSDMLTVQFVKDYAHLDFVMGFNANQVIYNSIIFFFEYHN